MREYVAYMFGFAVGFVVAFGWGITIGSRVG